MLNLLFALIGLAIGSLINILADNLPEKMRLQRPYCLQCAHVHAGSNWFAVSRWLRGDKKCPGCGARTRFREVVVEAVLVLLFAALPSLMPDLASLLINSFYIASLILIIVIDLEHRLILNVVTYPLTALALIGSLVIDNQQNTIGLALVGALTGFTLFFLAFLIGQFLFGPGALGYGDVKLAMALGAMLGFHRIVPALVLAILLGGVVSLLVLLGNRRVNRRTYLPYGQYLATAGIFMLIWGVQVVQWWLPDLNSNV